MFDLVKYTIRDLWLARGVRGSVKQKLAVVDAAVQLAVVEGTEVEFVMAFVRESGDDAEQAYGNLVWWRGAIIAGTI